MLRKQINLQTLLFKEAENLIRGGWNIDPLNVPNESIAIFGHYPLSMDQLSRALDRELSWMTIYKE